MRTRAELEIESAQLRQLARTEQTLSGRIATASTSPARLFTFPESSFKLYAAPSAEHLFTTRIVRHIDVGRVPTGLEFRLMEEEFVSDSAGNLARHYPPFELAKSDDAFDVLSSGYQRLEEDQFWERVEPVKWRIESDGFTEAEQAAAVAEIDRYASELGLTPSARLRVKSDAIDLLEGRLEMADFVSRTIARQDCFAVVHRVELSNQITESQEI